MDEASPAFLRRVGARHASNQPRYRNAKKKPDAPAYRNIVSLAPEKRQESRCHEDAKAKTCAKERWSTHAYHHPIHRTIASPMNAPTEATSTLNPMRMHFRAHSCSCFVILLPPFFQVRRSASC